MSIFKKGKAEPAQAVVDAQEHQLSDAENEALRAQGDATEADALEKHITEDDAAASAALELQSFRLTPGAKSLLDRGLDNLAQNKATGIEDPDAALAIKQRGELISAAGNDLSVVISALVASCDDNPRDIAPTIYSLCYNVLKAAGFIANIDYRRYCDPRGNFDLLATGYVPSSKGVDGRDWQETATFAADQREEFVEPPVGLDSAQDREREWLRATYDWQNMSIDDQHSALAMIYGATYSEEEDIFAASLEDLRLFFQLTCEAVGWDPNNVMPFTNVQNEDGTFTPITDAMTALDTFEIKRKESLAKRRKREAARLSKSAEIARKLVTQALAR